MRLLKSSLLFVALLFLVHLVHLAAAAGGRGESSGTSKAPKHDRDEAHIFATAGATGDSNDIARMPRDYWIQLRKAYNKKLYQMPTSEVERLRKTRDREFNEASEALYEAAKNYRKALKIRLNAIEGAPVLSPEALIKDDQDIFALQCGLEKEWIPVLLKRVKKFSYIDIMSDPWELSGMDLETRMKSYHFVVKTRREAERKAKEYTGPPLPLDEELLAQQLTREAMTELRNVYNTEFLKCMTEGPENSSDTELQLQIARTRHAARRYSKALGRRLKVINSNLERLEVGLRPRNKPGSLPDLLWEFEMEKESVLLIAKKLRVTLPILPEDELPISIKKMRADKKTVKLAELRKAREKREEEEREEAVLEEKGIEKEGLIKRRREETERLIEAHRVQAQADPEEKRHKEAEGSEEGHRYQAGPSA